MSESTLTLKKAILIIAVTWILSLASTLAIVYVEPSFFPKQAQPVCQNQIEIIRFHEPSEKNVTSTSFWHVVETCIWTPKNPTSNAILAFYCYFEYRCDNPEEYIWEGGGDFWWELKFGMTTNHFEYREYGRVRRSASSQDFWEERYSTEWKQICFAVDNGKLYGTAEVTEGVWINPNQNNYTLKFQVLHSHKSLSQVPTFVRNINVFIEVIDGIPSATI